MSEIYQGTIPDPRIISFSQDQKGVGKLVVLIPMVFASASAGSLAFPVPAKYPSYSGYGFAGAQAREAEGGAWNWEITYEGAGPLTSDNGVEDDQVIYAFEPSDVDLPISSHPEFMDFLKQFSGRVEDGRIIFEEALPRAEDQELVPRNKGNPFFGVEAYLSFGATWTKSYVARGQLPPKLLHNVEGVCDIPVPRGFTFPSIGKDRNWLKCMPSFRIRGTAVEITERYILSGRGGHNRHIYKAGGL